MKTFLTGLIVLTGAAASGQDSTAVQTASPFTFSGYMEGYYSYDFNKPANNTEPAFLYNHNRHNEFNVNLAFIRGSYAAEKGRATIAVGAGTYMNANYAAEPGTLKNIYEANAGFKIGKKALWFDIGVLPSHIGFESAVGKDCPTLTRSLPAENTPYFESGARLSYTTDNGKWAFSGLLLNGWQRITRLDGASKMSYGTQIQYKPSSAVTVSYSSFIGTDRPDSLRLNRIYHNLYGIFQITKSVGITAGFDAGAEQKSRGSRGYSKVYSPVLIFRYGISDKWAVAARGEYYSDAAGVFVYTGTPHGFKTTGYSLNVDYAPAANVLFRAEGRALHSKDAVFTKERTAVNSDSFITTSLAMSF